jgi:hypothetical protein
MRKPNLFIGSSTEKKDFAYAVQKGLEHVSNPSVWNQGIFSLSSSALESLTKALDHFDYAVFIFTPDDISKIRDATKRVVRDNVLFELGLFIGRLGRSRCFFVVPRGGETFHLPTDLAGVQPATYDETRTDNLEVVLGPAIFDISKALREAHDQTDFPYDYPTPRQISISKASQLIGLVDIEDRNDSTRALPPDSIWKTATEELFISGTTLSGVVTRKTEVINQLIGSGCSVKLLLLNPYSSDFQRISILAERDELVSELKATISTIRSRGWHRNGKFTAKYLTLPMLYSSTLIDCGIEDNAQIQSDAVLRIQPYLPSITPHAGLVIQLRSGADRDIFALYRRDIQSQWNSAVEIPELAAE